MIATVVFLLLLRGSNSWLLSATQTQVHVGRVENVTLTCQYDLDSTSRMDKVAGIWINKYSKDTHDDLPWKLFAQVFYNEVRILSRKDDGRVMAHGNTGQVSQSYLSVTWQVSSHDMLGTYICQGLGYIDQVTAVYFDTTVVTLWSALQKWEDILDSFNFNEDWSDKLKNESYALQNYSDGLRNQSGEFQIETVALLTESDELQRKSDELQKQSEVIHSKGISLLKNFASRPKTQPSTTTQPTTQPTNQAPKESPTRWPRGQVSLLKADTGCPKPTGAGKTWKEGYVRFHTESSGGKHPNEDSVSDPSHMVKPIKTEEEVNYFYMRTCMLDTESSNSLSAWPKGNYCVLKASFADEPAGFDLGYLRLDLENDIPWLTRDVNGSVIMYPTGDGNYVLPFLCRGDGDHSSPMELPVETPFYLFRRGGRCQEVLNAQVTEESFTLDTEDVENKDRAMSIWLPDLKVNPIHVHTCYYEPIA